MLSSDFAISGPSRLPLPSRSRANADAPRNDTDSRASQTQRLLAWLSRPLARPLPVEAARANLQNVGKELRLEYGCVALTKPRYKKPEALWKAADVYFRGDEATKRAHVRLGEHEVGYGAVGSTKEWFFVRDAQIPEPLRPEMQRAWAWCHELSLQCLRAIARDMQVPEQVYLDLVRASADVPSAPQPCVLRVFRYVPKSDARGQSILAQAHGDMGLLAIGLRTAPGLQAYTRTGWKDVERNLPAKDVVVITGRTLEAITNGRFKYGPHRVVAGPEERFSMVYHLRLRADALVSSDKLTSAATGQFAKPFNLTGAAFNEQLLRRLRNVNASTLQ